LLV
ncbi:bacterial regulatory helix-turn-helix s, AraC family protein, partial [Escherichia coli 93.0055]|jgi:hypothetical protein